MIYNNVSAGHHLHLCAMIDKEYVKSMTKVNSIVNNAKQFYNITNRQIFFENNNNNKLQKEKHKSK